MAGTGVFKTKTLLLRSCRGAKPVGLRFISKVSGIAQADKTSRSNNNNGDQKLDNSSFWVPHPRTGIYFLQGHERVMEDVPDDAASFCVSHWLRDIDGVDKPDPTDPVEKIALVCMEKKLQS